MADDEVDQQALVDEIEAALEAEMKKEEEAGDDEMDAIDDSESSPEMLVVVNSPEPEKSKGKGKKKKETKSKAKKERKALLSSSPAATVPLSTPSPGSTPGSRKRGRPKGSKDKKPRRSLAFEEIVGDDFTLHRLTVNPGEDLVKIMEKFNRQYKDQNVCVISASGIASKLDVHCTKDPMHFAGQFQLLSLSVGQPNADSQDRTLTASLSTFNGTVIGGILVGQCIAASHIHIITGTFKKTISSELSTANQNITLASEDVVGAPENVSANPNMRTAFEDIAADTNDQQFETDPNNVDPEEYGDILN